MVMISVAGVFVFLELSNVLLVFAFLSYLLFTCVGRRCIGVTIAARVYH